MATGRIYGQETLGTTPNSERETLRDISEPEAGSCTIYSVQAVVGIATPGCAIVGIDFGRRP